MLFKLKDTEVKEITPIYKDSYYEEGWCETCGGEWIDAEIQIEVIFTDSTSYIYRNNDNAEIKSITTVINYLFTHLNEFPNMTKDEFINHLNQQLNEDFKD
jgi:hypothetical protein